MYIFWNYRKVFDTKDECFNWWMNNIVRNDADDDLFGFGEWLCESSYTVEKLFLMEKEEQDKVVKEYLKEAEDLFEHKIANGEISVY